jgi:Galactose oxidase, central domain
MRISRFALAPGMRQRSGGLVPAGLAVGLILLLSLEIAPVGLLVGPSSASIVQGTPASVQGLAELEAARASMGSSDTPSRSAPAADPVAPSLRSGAATTWDAADGYVLLFGGCAFSSYLSCDGSYLNDTWEFSGGNWTELLPTESPPALYQAAMAYDSTDGVVVLFGGQMSDWNFTNPDLSNSTWEFRGGVWTNVTSTTAPSPRMGSSMADDPARGGTVLFGGLNQEPYATSNGTRVRSTVESDTWVFASGTWTNVTATVASAPPGRANAGMTYDPTETGGGVPVLFGGVNPVLPEDESDLNDTWLLGSSGWEEVTSSSAPPPESSTQMTYVSSSFSVVLFGGYNASNLLASNATWSFTNGTWSRLSPGAAPPPTWGGAFADDPTDGYGLLALGNSEYTYTEQNAFWTFANGNWTTLGTNTSAPPGGPATMVYDAADQEVLLVSPGYEGSTTGLEATWAYKSGNWSRVNSTLSPPALPNLDLVYDAADGYVLMVGEPHGTYAFHAGNWTEVSTQTPGGPGSIAYDAADGYVVYFSGDTTWKWFAAAWTQLHPTNQPVLDGFPAGPQSMAYDARDGYVIYVGPENGSCPGVSYNCLMTWAFSGGNWTDITGWSSIHPPPLLNTSLTYDAADQQLILFGGHNQSTGYQDSSNDTWAFAAGNWTSVTTSSAPAPRVGAAITYDGADGTVLLFGGVEVTPSGGLLLADTWSFSGGTWSQVAPSLVASEVTVDQGIQTILSVRGATFYPGAAYTYTGLPPGCTSVNAAELQCTPTAAGSYAVRAEVTAPATAASDASLVLTVDPPPSISSFSASRSSFPLGESTQLSAAPTGGTSPFTYSYSGLPPGCSSVDSSSLSCTPSSTGNFTVTVTLTDRFGLVGQDSLRLSVSPTGVVPVNHSTPSDVELYEILAVVVVGAVLAAAVTLRWTTTRRLRREGEQLVKEMREAVSKGPQLRNRPP